MLYCGYNLVNGVSDQGQSTEMPMLEDALFKTDQMRTDLVFP